MAAITPIHAINVNDVTPVHPQMVGVFGSSVSASTLAVLPLDMAPKWAGFLNALWMFLANLVGTSSPLLIAALTSENTLEQWRHAFILCSGMLFLSVLFFLCLVQAKLQPWGQEKIELDIDKTECKTTTYGANDKTVTQTLDSRL